MCCISRHGLIAEHYCRYWAKTWIPGAKCLFLIGSYSATLSAAFAELFLWFDQLREDFSVLCGECVEQHQSMASVSNTVLYCLIWKLEQQHFTEVSSSSLGVWSRLQSCRWVPGGCHPQEGKFWGFTVSAWSSLGAKLVFEVGISQKCAFALLTRNLQGFMQNLRPLLRACSCLRVRLPLNLSPGIFSVLSQCFWGYSALFGVLTRWLEPLWFLPAVPILWFPLVFR